MKERILKLLTQSDCYLSGEVLSHELGVSRTAVWKVINKLKEEGYAIDSVRNKGYRLTETTTELVEDVIKMALSEASRFQDIRIYETVDSTNTEAKRLWQQGDQQEMVILSREQSAGKGRRGKQWISPKDDGVFMSLLLRPDIEPVHASMLTLVAALAVCEAIEALTGLEPQIKWPNDLVLNRKKICGILTEMSAEMDFIHYVVVGIGINVNQAIFDDEIVDSATSIGQVWGQTLSRPALIAKIIERFEIHYNDFLVVKDLSYLMKAYNGRCINVGAALKVMRRNETIDGVGVAVSDDGTLQIRLTDGTITSVNAGEVSVRGLYGYV